MENSVTQRDLDQLIKSLDRSLDSIERVLQTQSDTNIKLISELAKITERVDLVATSMRHVEELVRGGPQTGLTTKMELLESKVASMASDRALLSSSRSPMEKTIIGAIGTGSVAGLLSLLQDLIRALS